MKGARNELELTKLRHSLICLHRFARHVSTSDLDLVWNADGWGNEFVRQRLSSDDFEATLSGLHFVDDEQVDPKQTQGDNSKDMLWKICWIYDKLFGHFSSFWQPGQRLQSTSAWCRARRASVSAAVARRWPRSSLAARSGAVSLTARPCRTTSPTRIFTEGMLQRATKTSLCAQNVRRAELCENVLSVMYTCVLRAILKYTCVSSDYKRFSQCLTEI